MLHYDPTLFKNVKTMYTKYEPCNYMYMYLKGKLFP